MATETEVQDQVRKIAEMYESLRDYAAVNTDNWNTFEGELEQLIRTAFREQLTQGIARTRERLELAFRTLSVPAAALLKEYARTEGLGSWRTGNIQEVLTELFLDFHELDKTIQSREFTYGAPAAAAGNVGDGVLYRLTVDAFGYALEAVHADTLTFKCISDQNTGRQKFNELFEVRGTAPGTDILESTTGVGTGIRTNVPAISHHESLLQNAGFDAKNGDLASPTSIPSWNEITDIANFEQTEDDADQFQLRPNQDNARSLIIKANDGLYQLVSQGGNQAAINPGVPVFPAVAVKRDSGCDGNIHLEVGGLSGGSVTTPIIDITKDMTTVSNSDFEILVPDNIQTLKELWYRQLAVNDLAVQVRLESHTTGQAIIGGVIWVQMPDVNGTRWLLLSGNTPFVRGTAPDEFEATDVENGAGLIQELIFYRGFNRHFPSRPPAPTSAPAAALAGAGAGNLDNDVYSYKVTFVNGSDKMESGASAKSNDVTVVDNSVDGQVDLTGIPTGSAACTSRKIYRTEGGGATYKFLTEINDNVTTTYTDNIADGSLGADIPAGVAAGITFADPT